MWKFFFKIKKHETLTVKLQKTALNYFTIHDVIVLNVKVYHGGTAKTEIKNVVLIIFLTNVLNLWFESQHGPTFCNEMHKHLSSDRSISIGHKFDFCKFIKTHIPFTKLYIVSFL